MTNLQNVVLEIIQNQGNKEEQHSFMEDVMQHGCISGIVGELISYHDTTTFYKEHKKDIDNLLYEAIQGTGLQPNELFGEKWENEDPLANELHNQNLLAWFAFEETTLYIYENVFNLN